MYTDPEQAIEFIQKTGCDSLAIAIGTSHGTVKFKGEAKLDFNRLAEIKNQSASYDAENYALAQKCKVTKVSTYVTLFVSAKHEDMQKIFDSAAK